MLKGCLLGWLLLVALIAPGFCHPTPSSAGRLHLHSRSIEAQLDLPISELRLGWGKPVPMDANLAVQQYGEALKSYVAAHIRPLSPDGRPWTVIVSKVTPVNEQIPDLRVDLTMTPPPGALADKLTFRMPSLILLARTRLHPPLRFFGASVTALAATAWLLERALG